MSLDRPLTDLEIIARAQQRGASVLTKDMPDVMVRAPDVTPRATSDLMEASGIAATAPVDDLFAGMNKLERRRAIELEAMRRDGMIAAWWYESLTLLLGPDCRYTPDFLIQEPNGALRLEEIKGHFREDAKVKVAVCASLFPFPLTVLQPDKATGAWNVTAY